MKIEIYKNDELQDTLEGCDITAESNANKIHQLAPCTLKFINDAGEVYNVMHYDGLKTLEKE